MPRIPTMRSSAAAGNHGLLGIPRLIVHALQRRATAAQLRNQLVKLDDRILMDIGLSRTDLTDVGGKLRNISRRKR